MTPGDFRVDKTAFSVVPLSQADDELAYWLTKTALQLTRRPNGRFVDSPSQRLYFVSSARLRAGN